MDKAELGHMDDWESMQIPCDRRRVQTRCRRPSYMRWTAGAFMALVGSLTATVPSNGAESVLSELLQFQLIDQR